MGLSEIDPVHDERWRTFVNEHPASSAFHTPEWLESLAMTYDYEPFAITTAHSGQPLSDGLALCRVSSWITGRRLVSIPFADHCEPLIPLECFEQDFESWLREECDREQLRYVELRPSSSIESGDCWKSAQSYYSHILDIRPALNQIFSTLDKSSLQRRIRHAEKQSLNYEIGRSDKLLRDFYSLLCQTRRRHGLFPQPVAWFRNLSKIVGENLQIRVLRKLDHPIASILTLRHRQRVIYKYGCSDERYHHLAGMPLLFWKLIEESKAQGIIEVDFGRSDLDQGGLIAFKDHFGCRKTRLTYVRYCPSSRKSNYSIGKSLLRDKGRKQIMRFIPEVILKGMGRVLYRHLG